MRTSSEGRWGEGCCPVGEGRAAVAIAGDASRAERALRGEGSAPIDFRDKPNDDAINDDAINWEVR